GTKEPADREMAKIVMRAFQLGLLVFYGGIYSNVMEITPPLIMTEAEADEGLAILEQAIAEVEAGEGRGEGGGGEARGGAHPRLFGGGWGKRDRGGGLGGGAGRRQLTP